MAVADRETGRFRSKYDPLTLMSVIVPAVARAAAEPDDDPREVTQRAYDQACSQSGFPDAPSTDATAQRPGLSWPDLLQRAFDPTRSDSQNLGAASRRPARSLSAEAAAEAVQLIHGRFCQPGQDLARARYDRLRDRLIESGDGPWLHGARLEDRIPTSNQIRARYAASDSALDPQSSAPGPEPAPDARGGRSRRGGAADPR